MTSVFKKPGQVELPCVFAFKFSGVYSFVIADKKLPRLTFSQIESLKLSKLFKPEIAFQRGLAQSKREAVLFTELPASQNSSPAETLQSDSALVRILGNNSELKLLTFALAAKELEDGDEKRILQMAVQYLAAGGLEDNLVAAEYDWDFIQLIKSDPEKKH